MGLGDVANADVQVDSCQNANIPRMKPISLPEW